MYGGELGSAVQFNSGSPRLLRAGPSEREQASVSSTLVKSSTDSASFKGTRKSSATGLENFKELSNGSVAGRIRQLDKGASTFEMQLGCE